MKYRRLIPILIPLFIWILGESFFQEPAFFYVSLFIGILALVFSVKTLVREEERFWVPFIIPPVLFLAGFWAYSAIIVGSFWLQLINLLILWYLFSYLRTLYYYFSATGDRKSWAAKLDNLMLSGSFLSAFSVMAFFFDLPAFLNWPLYFLLPCAAGLGVLLFSQFRLLPKEGAYDFRFPLISVLLLTELAGVLALLPLNFNLLALFFAIFYYLCLIIIRLASSGTLNWRGLKLPLVLGAIMIFLLLLTARWL